VGGKYLASVDPAGYGEFRGWLKFIIP
jgi:hypothetical protein